MQQHTTFANIENPGPNLLVVGSVHGSEPCGTYAIDQAIGLFQSEALTLQKGAVTFVPRANAKAFANGTRTYEGNLARLIIKKDLADFCLYEEKVAQYLIPLIEEADYIVDLHSCNSETPPFIFQDINTPEAEDFCARLGAEFVIVGWNDYFDGKDIPNSIQAYANKIGKVCATIECGSHHDPASVTAGLEAFKNAARYLGMIGEDQHAGLPVTSKKYRLLHHFLEDAPGKLAQDYKGLQEIAKGQHILTYYRNDKEELAFAEEDCRILMPSRNGYHPDQKTTDIWTYLIKPV